MKLPSWSFENKMDTNKMDKSLASPSFLDFYSQHSRLYLSHPRATAIYNLLESLVASGTPEHPLLHWALLPLSWFLSLDAQTISISFAGFSPWPVPHCWKLRALSGLSVNRLFLFGHISWLCCCCPLFIACLPQEHLLLESRIGLWSLTANPGHISDALT